MLGKGQGSQPLSGAGNRCQPREVVTNSISDHCLLWNQDRLADFPGFGNSLEDRKVLLNSRRISVLKGAVCEVLESLARPPRLSVSPCSEWSALNESSSIGSKSRLGFSGRGYSGSLGSSFSGRLQPRLGGHCRRPVRFRCLAGGQGLSLNQPTRVVGCRERPQGSLYLFGRSGCRSLLRQHDSGGVSEEARRDLVSGSERSSPAHSALGGGVAHHPDASVCSREEQCSGGRSVSPQPGSRLGVDAPSGCVQLAPICLHPHSVTVVLFILRQCGIPWLRVRMPCLPSLRYDRSGPGEGEVLSGSGADAHSSTLAPASVVSRAADSAPSSSSISMGCCASATHQKIPSKPFHASSSCMESLRRFARASCFSRSVARRLGQTRKQSSVANYQSKWLTYRRWCTDKGHSVSQPSVSKVADCLVWLWEDQGLSLSSIKAHRSMLSSVFQFKLPALGEDRVLHDLVRSFAIERPRRPQVPPSWDLDAVLRHLMSSAFEPLEPVSLRTLTKKTLFLVSLATAKRVSEIQALSKLVAAIGNDLVVPFQPHFIAKTECVDAPVPRSFRVLSLREFAGDLEEGSLLCPVRALNIYRCSVYFAPVWDPMAAGTDAMLQSWDSLQAYAFPRFAMIGQVLAKVRSSQGLELTLIAPLWPQRPWFPELLILPPLPLPSRWDCASATRQKIPSKPVHAWRLSGDSREPPTSLVAWLDDFGQARRQSSVAHYQSKWLTYRRWCTDKGHSVSQPSVSKVADYLVRLWEDQGLSLSSIKAHRSMLSSVFQFKLPALGEDRVLHDLVRSFAIERPRRPQVPPSWDLDAVLRHLMSSAFEPLESVSLRTLTKKTLFLVSLATAKRLVRSRPCRS